MSLRTDHIYKIDALYEQKIKTTDDFYKMPIIEPEHFLPTRLVGFNYIKDQGECDFGMHFFLDDNQFERIWNRPARYVNMLKRYECMLTPDFSLYTDMPTSMLIWNTYRSRFLGAYYQSKGIKVIPTVSWAEKDSYNFCFAGLPRKATLAISTLGVRRYDTYTRLWREGLTQMLERLEPTDLIVYGAKVDFDYGNTKTHYYENETIARLKKIPKKKKVKKEDEKNQDKAINEPLKVVV